jgi:hypothetical protein
MLSTIVDYVTPKQFGWHNIEILWPFFLLISWLLFLYSVIKAKSCENTFSLRSTYEILAVFLVLLAVRLWFIDAISVWLDEIFNAEKSFENFPLFAGARQHQPPADSVLTNLGLWISNISVWGLRIHTCIASALAGSLLYGLTKHLSRSRIVAAGCVVFFSFQHHVFRYGFEARPISLGLFLELMFIAAVFAQTQKETPWRENLYLPAMTFLYLSSLGLQPAFLVGISIVFFLFLSLFNKRHFKTCVLIFSGLLMYLPNQRAIFAAAPERFSSGEVFNLAKILEQLKIENFTVLTSFCVPWAYICGAILLLYVIQLFRKKITIDVQTVYLVFVCVGFPLTLIPYFISHINWSLNDYYLISELPLLFLLFSSLWGYVFESHNPINPAENSRNFDLSFLKSVDWKKGILSVTEFAFASTTFDFKDRFRSMATERQDLKSAYRLIEEIRSSDDVVLSLCLTERKFCPGWLLGEQFYLKGSARNFLNPFSVVVFIDALKSRVPVRNIIFLYNQMWSMPDLGTQFRVGNFNGVSVYKIPVEKDAAETMLDFLGPAVLKAASENIIYPQGLSYLHASYSHLGDLKNKSKVLEMYKNRPPYVWYDDVLKNEVSEQNKKNGI